MTQVAEKPPIEEVVEHFGTKGMHWGVRKGKGTTGVSRSSGALIDRNARTTRIIKDAQAGKKYKVSVAVGKKILGAEQQQRNWKMNLATMKAQDKRLKAGKQNWSDRIDKYANVGLLDLGITATPR